MCGAIDRLVDSLDQLGPGDIAVGISGEGNIRTDAFEDPIRFRQYLVALERRFQSLQHASRVRTAVIAVRLQRDVGSRRRVERHECEHADHSRTG
jgi:hypothetical protein